MATQSTNAAEYKPPVKKAAAPVAKAKPKPKKAVAKQAVATATPVAGVANPLNTAQPTAKVNADLLAYVQKYYGDYMMHFVNDPEVGPLIIQAAQNGYDANRLRGMLSNTKWWKSTSQSARTWEQGMAEDPASANQQIDQVKANIHDQAETLGIALDDKRLTQIATDSLRFGWDATQIMDTLAQQPKGDAKGTIDVTTQAIKALAKSYMLPLGDSAAFDWAMRIAKGEMSMDTVKFLLGEQAKSRFPALATVIDQGGTPADYFAPYKHIAAQTLELPETSIDFTQGKWSTVLQAPDDPTQVMRLTDFERMLKTDQKFGYQYTNQANDTVDSLTLFLGDRFGATTS